MSLILWSHPYAGYGQKASVALYELALPFELKLVDAQDEAVMTAFRAVSPLLDGTEARLNGTPPDANGIVKLWANDVNGRTTMTAEATLA